MPDAVKYERIQTADTDQYAGADYKGTTIADSPPTATRIDIPSQRSRFGVAQATAAALILILCYFCLSIGLTFYQRWLLKSFKFPLFVVLCHLIIKLLISLGIRLVYRLCTGRSRVHLDWRSSVRNVAPTGLASGIDIGFSNWGLELVAISLYTMTKSTTIVFILIFAILLGLEKRTWSVMTIVVSISLGLSLFTYKFTEFNALGFSFLLFASLVSGLRWTFAQLIMQRSKIGLHNPIDMVYHMQPWMILSILPFTLGFEGPRLYEGLSQLSAGDADCVWSMALKIVGGSVIAFFMELSEFLVLSVTSSLTLAVTGIFKEICQLVLAVELNGDRLSPLNVVGLVMCVGGILSHALHKYTTMVQNDKRAGIMGAMNGGEPSALGDRSDDGEDCVVFDRQSANVETPVKWRAGQSVPLLDEADAMSSDSDDATSQKKQTSSDIIFDVLKRRDARR